MPIKNEILIARKRALEDKITILKKNKADALKSIGKKDIHQYIPHDKQREFHQSNARVRIILGSNSSGKTTAGAVEAALWATKDGRFKSWLEDFKKPTHGVVAVVSRDQQVFPGAAQDKLLQYLPEESIGRKGNGGLNIEYARDSAIRRINLKGGSTITFITANAARAAWQGARYNWIWIDEEIFKTSTQWNEIVTRVPDGGDLDEDDPTEASILHIFMSATPNLEGFTFMRKAVYEKCNKDNPDYRLWEVALHDNTFMTDEAKAAMIEDISKDDMVEYNARVHGEWRTRKGLVYKYNEAIHVIPPLSDSILEQCKGFWRIVDPHESKPICVLFVAALGDGRIVAFDELKRQGLVEQIVDESLKRCVNFEHKCISNIIDYSANKKSKTDGRSISGDFKRYGMPVRNCVKTVTAGINAVSKMLYYTDERSPRLYVTANCLATRQEFSSYAWKQDDSGKPVKQNDEFMDCLRYLFCDRTIKPFIKGIIDFKKPKSTIYSDRGGSEASMARMNRRNKDMGLGLGIGR